MSKHDYYNPLSGIGFYVGAGILKGKRSNVYVECGCCGQYHREDFFGDCRENSERFAYPPASAVVVSLEDQMNAEED